MSTLKQINEFLNYQPIALVGVSRNPKKFGRIAFEELTRKGLRVMAINPNIDSINGSICYAGIKDLPANVKSLIIMTNKNQTAQVVEDALAKGIENIWIQQSSDTPEALALLKDKEVNLITKQCILMHHKPNGFHKFHRNLKALFGGMPR